MKSAWQRTLAAILTLPATVAAPALAGCGSSLEDSARGTDGPAVVVDPVAGSLGPVAIGDSMERFVTSFGPRLANRRGDEDTWWKLGTPGSYGYPARCTGTTDRPGRNPKDFAYHGVEVSFCADRAFLVSVTSRGSRTTAGARIGEPLDQAAARHPQLQCDVSTANTSDPPVPVYRYCTGRIGPQRYLWLGQDPVSSIAIATVPLG
jgi:hypothetical protein